MKAEELKDGIIYHSRTVNGHYFKVISGNRDTGWYKMAWMNNAEGDHHVQIINPTTVMKVADDAREISKLEVLLKVPKKLREAQ